ncbi:MAG: DUF4402 domain-containing protein [candidate division Zixibacteria bacterium]|nr:DUF4402 domain-containing protein [candidate division Zixibacteria bacterium]
MERKQVNGLSGKLAVAALLTLFVLPMSSAFGQDVATGQAIANVLAALSITATTDLDFGNVYQGVAVTAAKDNSTVGTTAGVFTITGEAAAEISVYMVLPAYLATVSGDDRMTVSFNTTDAAYDNTGNVDPAAFGGGVANVDPNNWTTAPTDVGAGGTSAIFLGGRVTPSVNQAAGPYSGDITVTVAYTGT